MHAKKFWILSGPLLLAALLASVHFFQRFDFGLRPLDNFDIATLRVMKALVNDPELRNAGTLILGDSTAFFNLNPHAIPGSVSLALSNSSIRESYFLLRRLLAQGSRPRCIVASFSFQWPDADEYFWSMFVRNGFYSSEELREIQEIHAQEELGSSTPMFWVHAALYRAKIYGTPLERIRRSLIPDPKLEKRKENFARALARGKGWLGMTDVSRFNGNIKERFPYPPRRMASTDEYSRRLVALLESHGIRLFLVDTPISTAYSEEERREYEIGYEAAAGVLLANGTTERVRLPVLPASQFFTAGHLLLPGSNEIMPRIRAATEDCVRTKDK